VSSSDGALRRRAIVSIPIVYAVAAAIGCSSNGEGQDGPSGTGGDFSDDIAVSTGGGGPTGAGGGPVRDGGSIALTPEQLSAIREQACTGESTEAEQFPAVLELVVDVSTSMREPAPGGGGSKWDVTQKALLEAIAKLPNSIAVGLQLYPTSDASTDQSNPGCVDSSGNVPIASLGASGSTQRASLDAMLRGVTLKFGTPTHDAYDFALQQGLGEYDGLGQRFMLLITDGAPTQLQGCGVLKNADPVATAPIIATIAAAADQGVRSFVIGSPGSEVSTMGDMRPWLSEAAFVGGTALVGCSINGPAFCHLDMTEAPDFTSALSQGLSSISAQVGDGCTFEVPEKADIDRATTSLIIEWGGGQADLVLNVGSGACAGTGWTWDPAGKIELCDATCARVNETPGARVSVSLDCDIADIEDIFK
jgi:hypothetical protein